MASGMRKMVDCEFGAGMEIEWGREIDQNRGIEKRMKIEQGMDIERLASTKLFSCSWNGIYTHSFLQQKHTAGESFDHD